MASFLSIQTERQTDPQTDSYGSRAGLCALIATSAWRFPLHRVSHPSDAPRRHTSIRQRLSDKANPKPGSREESTHAANF